MNESIKYRSIPAFCSYPSSRERWVAIPPDINEENQELDVVLSMKDMLLNLRLATFKFINYDKIWY